jgi:uncharacterized protein (DUF2141 family)
VKLARRAVTESAAWLAAFVFLISFLGPAGFSKSVTFPVDSSPPAATLVVQVEGARNERGLLRVALFDGREGFPERSEFAAHTISVAVGQPLTEVRFEDVEPGLWALAVLHDENENGRLDRNFLRMPTEGVGASNDAARRGSPRFDDARFSVPAQGSVLRIALHYWR